MKTTEEIVRVDKNVLLEIFKNDYFKGKNGHLLISLIHEFCRSSQNSIFQDEIVLDVSDFAKRFSYKTNDLQKKINDIEISKKEIVLKGVNENEQKTFTRTVIVDALYYLFTQKIVFSKPPQYIKKTKQNGEEVIITLYGVTGINVIKELVWCIKKYPNKRIKTNFIIKLDEDFVSAMAYYFSRINLKTLAELRKSNLEAIYLYLKSMEDMIKMSQGRTQTLQFSYFCELMGINQKNKKHEKKMVKAKFAKFIEKTSMPFELTFEKGEEQRYAYTPVLIYTGEEKQQDVSIVYQELFFECFLREIGNLIHKDLDILDALDVRITDIDAIDFVLKEDIYVLSGCYIEAYKKAFKNPHKDRLDELKVSWIFRKILELHKKTKLMSRESLLKLLSYDINKIRDLEM